ncbi:hypothetical protein C8Q79DRAFT_955206 [Trametes meyenii]|nr:hypothetical protein C8Q79DRAFT_955206 [Trametes meyenii]
MKFFSTILPVVGVVATFALGIVAQRTTEVIQSIHVIADASNGLRQQIEAVTIKNIADNGPGIPKGIVTLVQDISGQTQSVFLSVSNPKPLNDNDAQAVVNALNDFVAIHQALLETIIGKHSLAQQFFLTRPIAIALRSLESVVDTFAHAIIDLIPTRADEGNADAGSLQIYLQAAVSTYES